MIKIENKKYCVYRHRRLDTNKIFYIGIGSLHRAYSKCPSKRNKIWNGITSRTNYEIEILAENLDLEIAFELEIFLIEMYGRINLNTGTLCNLTNGGDGSKGCSPSKETREKIGNFHKNKIVSIESREKMRKAKEGKFFLSDNPNAKKVINIETGEIWDSLNECCIENNLNSKYMSRWLSNYRPNKTNYKYLESNE